MPLQNSEALPAETLRGSLVDGVLSCLEENPHEPTLAAFLLPCLALYFCPWSSPSSPSKRYLHPRFCLCLSVKQRHAVEVVLLLADDRVTVVFRVNNQERGERLMAYL